MALPLTTRKRTDSAADQAFRWARMAALHAWGLRVPLLILAIWLRCGHSTWAAAAILGAVLAVAAGLQHWDLLEPAVRHEVLHWRAQRIRATWPATALDVGLWSKGRPSRLRTIRQSPTGLAVTVRPYGGEHGVLDHAAKGLELAWRAKAVSVRKLSRGRVRFDVTTRDTLADPIPYPHGLRSDRSAVPFGVDEHGRAVTLPLWNGHLLMSGTTGSGKSWALHTILAGLATLPDTALVLCDPKRVELAHWRPRASIVATDMASIDLVLQAAVALTRARFEAMDDLGLQLLEPNADHPHVVVVIEELAVLMGWGSKAVREQRVAWLKELALQARAAAVSLVAVTQQPRADVIPTDIRGQMTRRIALATATWDESKMILGNDPAPAHLLSLAQPGTCYVQADGTRRARLARAYWLDGDGAAAIARQTASLRVGPSVVAMPALALPALPEPIEID